MNAEITGTVGENKALIQRPSISFERITFSDGQSLDFEEDEIIVFVGPNNAGKSAALRELQEAVARSGPRLVISDSTLRKTGNSDLLRQYLEQSAQKTVINSEITYGGIGFNIHHSHVFFFDQQQDRHPVAPFFCTRLATEDRITASNPAQAIGLHREPPTHPIHLLLIDPNLGETISTLFRRAFGKDLILFRAGGGQFPLFVGKNPNLLTVKTSYVNLLLKNCSLVHRHYKPKATGCAVLRPYSCMCSPQTITPFSFWMNQKLFCTRLKQGCWANSLQKTDVQSRSYSLQRTAQIFSTVLSREV